MKLETMVGVQDAFDGLTDEELAQLLKRLKRQRMIDEIRELQS